MRRREILQGEALADRLLHPTPPVTPKAVPAEGVRAPAGHCPRCGEHIGRAIRAHTKTCTA